MRNHHQNELTFNHKSVILGKFQLRVMHRDMVAVLPRGMSNRQKRVSQQDMFGIAVKLSFARQPDLIYLYVDVYNPY